MPNWAESIWRCSLFPDMTPRWYFPAYFRFKDFAGMFEAGSEKMYNSWAWGLDADTRKQVNVAMAVRRRFVRV
jgi:hypothetical protein